MIAKRKLNKPLLRRLARRLRRLRHEEHYYQGYWAKKTECGTAACLASHAVLLAGYRPVFEPYESRTSVCCQPGGRLQKILDVAARLLGVSSTSRLFSGDPTGSSLDYPWPEPYRTRWAEHKERPSRIAADLLDAIAVGEVKL